MAGLSSCNISDNSYSSPGVMAAAWGHDVWQQEACQQGTRDDDDDSQPPPVAGGWVGVEQDLIEKVPIRSIPGSGGLRACSPAGRSSACAVFALTVLWVHRDQSCDYATSLQWVELKIKLRGGRPCSSLKRYEKYTL